MNEHDKTDITRQELATYGIIVVLFLVVGFLAIYARSLQDRLDSFEKSSNETIESQQAQIDGLSLNIETVRSEMSAGFESQQSQIDKQQEQLTTQKGIQSNTIKAFVRYQKQQAEQNEAFKEELKND